MARIEFRTMVRIGFRIVVRINAKIEVSVRRVTLAIISSTPIHTDLCITIVV